MDAVADAFSPATEFLGALGDVVRLARVEVAARITRRAKEIADENGLRLSAPPLKFLVPFYEKASLEHEESLIEWWARILLSESKEKSANLIYADILSKLNKETATAFSNIMTKDSDASVSEDVPLLFDGTTIERTSEYQQLLDYDRQEDILDRLIDYFEQPGVVPAYLACWPLKLGTKDGEEYYEYESPRGYRDLSFHVSILSALGLVREHNVETNRPVQDTQIVAAYYYCTELGLRFWYELNGLLLPSLDPQY